MPDLLADVTRVAEIDNDIADLTATIDKLKVD